MKLSRLIAALLFAASALASVTPVFAIDIKVENAWIREPAPGQSVVGGFLNITSPKNAELVQVKSPAAGLIEMHEMRMNNGVMQMRPLQKITLPKAQTVKLEPGGLHLMLEELKQPLKAGDKVPLTLKIKYGKKTDKITVSAEVRSNATAPSH